MDIENTLVMHGGAIKALGEGKSGGNAGGRPVGRLGGVLCRFSSADDPDQSHERDFFDADTNFKMMDGLKTPIYYHHGLHADVGIKEIGEGVLRWGPGGIDIESELWLDDADGAKFYRQAKAGKLAWSSGTAAHLVKRTPVAAKSGHVSHHIDFWPLGLDASLTPTAAEPRNIAVALKSLLADEQAAGRSGAIALGRGSYSLGSSGSSNPSMGSPVMGIPLADIPFMGASPLSSLSILEAGQREGSRLVDHTARLHEAIAEYGERIQDIALNRALTRAAGGARGGSPGDSFKAGRVFSAQKHAMLSDLLDRIRDAADDLAELLDAHAPDRETGKDTGAPDDDTDGDNTDDAHGTDAAIAGKSLDAADAELEQQMREQQQRLDDLLRELE